MFETPKKYRPIMFEGSLTKEQLDHILSIPHLGTAKAKMSEYTKTIKFKEQFIREYIEYFDLGEVFIFQDVSKEFIREFASLDHLIHILFGTDLARNDKKFYDEIETRFMKRLDKYELQ